MGLGFAAYAALTGSCGRLSEGWERCKPRIYSGYSARAVAAGYSWSNRMVLLVSDNPTGVDSL